MQLIVCHDALRFSFFVENEMPFLKLNPLQSINFKLDYFTSTDDVDIEQYITAFKQKTFALSDAPLFRAALINKGKKKSLFLFSIHHIIHDGWSLNILLRELSAIYNTCIRQITLPSVIEFCPYLHFIHWQQEMLSDEVLEKQRMFWKKYLFHMPKLELIYDKLRHEEEETPRNHRLTFKINSQVTRKLKKIAIANHVTLYDVLLSL